MNWIKYQICCNEEKGIYLTKKLEFSVDNLKIASEEAYNGSYEVVPDEKHDDEYFKKQPLALELGGTGCKTKEDILFEFGIIPTYEDATYPGCCYRLTEDGIQEWINPPMIYNTEYRTTERFNGKSVYVKAGYDSNINDNSTAMEGMWVTGIYTPKNGTLIDATGTVKKWISSTVFQKDVLILGENLSIGNTGEIRFVAKEGEASQDYTDFIVTVKYTKD